ncbi:MAG: hypothetical protein N2Z22_11255 [Turneriella sp.]|nr:hypothetical protein [Turneriella sp.]
MRLRKLILILGICAMPTLIFARANTPQSFGLGGIIGEPTGLSAKYTIDRQFALQGALALSLLERGLWLGADFLIQFFDAISKDGKAPLYVGGGFVLQDRGGRGKGKDRATALGIRAVAGIEFAASDRITIFGEASAQPFFIPSLDFGFAVGAGARYWF